MILIRLLGAFIAAVGATYVLATAFFTQQVIAKHAAIGATYTAEQQIQTFAANFTGLWIYGIVLAIALLVGFAVAAIAKRILTPLARIAYPLAGASAVLVAVWLIEQQLGGGAGVIGGARDALGVSLQGLAGAGGGLVFALLSARR